MVLIYISSLDKFLLDGSLDDYRFTKHSRKDIDGVDDVAEFETLVVCIIFIKKNLVIYFTYVFNFYRMP